MDPTTLLALFDDVVAAVREALDALDDWSHLGAAGAHGGQYRHDVVADAAALDVLDRAGVGVLSEESGLRRGDAEIVVIIDPVDGSTNASRGIPWFATSLCAVDRHGPLVSMVVNQATGTCYRAQRGAGAWRDGVAIRPRHVLELGDSIVALSALPPRHLGWRQYRTMGAAALDLCGVADGTFDAYVDCGTDAHGVWDYAGALLVCREVGVSIEDAFSRDLVVLDPSARRTPVAAASEALQRQVLEARRSAV